MAQVAGVAGMGAAADFLGEGAHGVYLYALAVLVAEQAYRALRSGLVYRHFLAGDGGLGLYPLVDLIFYLLKLFLGELAAEAEIEAKTLGGYVGAPLADGAVVEHLAQRRLKQMGCAVEACGL